MLPYVLPLTTMPDLSCSTAFPTPSFPIATTAPFPIATRCECSSVPLVDSYPAI